jgi:GNAT superfamily N-acetyltransferase
MDVRELTADDCHLAHLAMRELRPQVGDLEQFVERVRRQFGQGYRLIGAFDGEHEHAVSVAGFRIDEKLAWGRHVYIDDLSTLPEGRGRGGATALLRWIDALAVAEGITEVHLDSGVQPERQAAHALYFREGHRISSYHFQKALPLG